MTKKLSKANMALIFFLAVLLLSVYAQIAFKASIPSNYYPQYYVRAESLTVEPEKYFTLTNPDQYVLRAINGEDVVVRQIDTQIVDLERQYGTSNVVYNGSYYSIGIAFVDAFPPPTLPHILAGFAISIIGNSCYSNFSGRKILQATNKVDLFQRYGVPTHPIVESKDVEPTVKRH